MSVLIAVPLLAERLALGRRVAAVRAGAGPRSTVDVSGHSGLLITGVAGGLTDATRPGDLVVATEIRDTAGRIWPCPAAADLVTALAAALAPRGHTVHTGPLIDAGHIVDGPERAGLAATGAVAVDTESARLAAAAGGRPVLAVRAISDGPAHPLRSVHIVRNGLSALRSLRAAGRLLADWAPTGAPVQGQGDEEVG